MFYDEWFEWAHLYGFVLPTTRMNGLHVSKSDDVQGYYGLVA